MKSTDYIEQEVRIALVLYGGISLAVYMNGMVQELLRLVRSTSPAVGQQDLTGSELVYQKIARFLPTASQDSSVEDLQGNPVRTRYMVDIISGTSAGGINGVFLAKAIARNESINALSDLWRNEAELSTLLNDKRPWRGSTLGREHPPQALFSSQRMYYLLCQALGIGGSGSFARTKAVPSPVTLLTDDDELDLFVTATDIEGRPILIKLNDGETAEDGKTLEEKQHKQHFQFSWRKSPDLQNDFEDRNIPFLAFAARCSSSIPPAFPAMTLNDALPVLQELGVEPAPGLWEKFYPEYKTDKINFRTRAFGDGGYLDNKPFTYATAALLRRRAAGVPVERKLIYIEPSPEVISHTIKNRKLNIIENSFAAAFSLPRYQTIREDLESIMARNRLLKKINELVDQSAKEIGSDGDLSLQLTYPTYLRLRVNEIVEFLADLIGNALGLPPQSDEKLAIAEVIKWWKAENGEISDEKFLEDYPLPFVQRQLQFLSLSISDLLRNDTFAKTMAIASCHDLIAEVQLLRNNDRRQYCLILGQAKESIRVRLRKIREAINTWNSENQNQESPLHEKIKSFAPDFNAQKILCEGIPRQWQHAQFNMIAEFLSDQVTKMINSSDMESLFMGITHSGIKKVLDSLKNRFLRYDFVTFPIIYGTAASEANLVTVHRFSEKDGRELSAEDHQHLELLGKRFAAFGAFFERQWRENDILLGRLHGAACLISALLPVSRSADRKVLIKEAQDSIYKEHLEFLRRNGVDTQRFQDPRAYSPIPLNAEEMTRSTGRSVSILGRILEELAISNNFPRQGSSWLLFAGRILVGLVGLATPRDLFDYLLKQFVYLSYFLGIALILFSPIIGGRGVAFGSGVVVFTLVLHSLSLCVRAIFVANSRRRERG